MALLVSYGPIDSSFLDGVESSNTVDFSSIGTIPDASSASVVSVSATAHTSSSIAQLSRILKPGGTLVLREPALSSPLPDGGQGVTLRNEQQAFLAMTLAGQVDVKIRFLPTAIAVDGFGDPELLRGHLSLMEATSTKPDWAVGSTATVKSSLKNKGAASNGQATASVWTFSSKDVVEDEFYVEEDELMDEDDLLDESDLLKPVNPMDDCGLTGGKRKACKSCSCGRADEPKKPVEKAKPVAKPVPKPAPKPMSSACGNCSLGDAFRCGGCPFLGKPAFEKGDEVKLLMSDDM